jgi:hydroxymethylbilane synthase
VAHSLQKVDPDLQIEWVWITTQGDRLSRESLRELGGKGLFVKEIEQALLAGTIDLAVHSAKDLPASLPPGLIVSATPPRASPFDLLISKEPLDEKKRLRVGTSSLRREVQIREKYPHWEIVPLRGNLDTRWEKVNRGILDLIVVAEAGVRRLWEEPPGWYQVANWMLPAPCQGILAIEMKEERKDLKPLLQEIHDRNTGVIFSCERRVMERVGGGCLVPFAVLAEIREERISLTARLWDGEGNPRGSFRGEVELSRAMELADRAGESLLSGVPPSSGIEMQGEM